MHFDQFFLLPDDHKRIIDDKQDYDQPYDQEVLRSEPKSYGTEETEEIQRIADHRVRAFADKGFSLVARNIQCRPEPSQNAHAHQKPPKRLEKQEMIGFVLPRVIAEQENRSNQNNKDTR